MLLVFAGFPQNIGELKKNQMWFCVCVCDLLILLQPEISINQNMLHTDFYLCCDFVQILNPDVNMQYTVLCCTK